MWKQGDGLYTLGASLRIFFGTHWRDRKYARSYLYDHVCTSTNLKDASDLLLCESINFLLFLTGSRIASLVNPDMVAANRSFHLWTTLRLALLCINPTVISLEAGGFYIHPDSWSVTSCAQQETRRIFKLDMPIFIALYVFGRLEHGSYKATRPNRPGFLLPFVAISCEFVARIGHGSSQGTIRWNITNKIR